jgi:adenine/guanine phosphoribosyltransferase-like PRPP-binding protein
MNPELLKAFDNKPLMSINGYQFIINPLTEQIPYTSSSLLNAACATLSKLIDKEKTTKLVSEEDKGGIILGGVSLMTGLPIGVARWYPNGLAEQIQEKFNMEYAGGSLYLNGVNKGDVVTIIDDVISSGGTLISLIKAVEKSDATINDIICIGEKVNYQGVARVKKETGYDVKTILQIDISGKYSKIINVKKYE